MERIRVAGIIPMGNGFAFMHRKGVIKRKDYQEYYTLEEGVIREIKEEFGIDVKVIKKMYEMKSPDFNQLEYYFLCKYVGRRIWNRKRPRIFK